jgi:hypothetical protein
MPWHVQILNKLSHGTFPKEMCSVVVNEHFDPKEVLGWIFDFAY